MQSIRNKSIIVIKCFLSSALSERRKEIMRIFFLNFNFTLLFWDFVKETTLLGYFFFFFNFVSNHFFSFPHHNFYKQNLIKYYTSIVQISIFCQIKHLPLFHTKILLSCLSLSKPNCTSPQYPDSMNACV